MTVQFNPSIMNLIYEYTIADHLGNGGLYFDVISGTPTRLQQLDYYECD